MPLFLDQRNQSPIILNTIYIAIIIIIEPIGLDGILSLFIMRMLVKAKVSHPFSLFYKSCNDHQHYLIYIQ